MFLKHSRKSPFGEGLLQFLIGRRRSPNADQFVQWLSLCLIAGVFPAGFGEPTNSPPASLYLQVQMGPNQKTPGFIHFFGRISRDPWHLPHHNITEKGIFPGARTGMVQEDGHTLAAGDESPWVEIAPLLSTNGINFVELTACSDYGKLLPESDFTVVISRTESREGLIKSFSRSGSGAGMHIVIDLADRQSIRNDLECSREALAVARALPDVAGKRPKQFPVSTGCFVRPDIHTEEIVRNEIEILAKLGFSGLAPYPVYIQNGFVHPRATISYWHFRQDHCINALEMPRVRQWLTSSVKEFKDKGVLDKLLYVSLMDEPSSPSLDHITECKHCIRKFPEYLKSQGLKPSDFGENEWSEVKPSQDFEKEPKLYYYSLLFRHQSLADFFKIGTEIIQATSPNLPTTVNFAESLTYYGNLIHRGADWFTIMRSKALTFGWNEDWLPFNASPQLCGYHADFLRSACKYHDQPFGYYTILKQPLDTELKAVTEIGHGAKAIFHYNYGPYYTGASDADSQKYERYPSLRRVNHAIGAVEEYLVDAKVPPSKIALHYSHATDIWRLKEAWSLYGRERSYVYLILRHLGYPVDVLTEDDIIEGRLKDYEFLVLLGSHLKRDAVPKLVEWTHNGGFLYVGAGTGERDEFNQPLDFANQLGLQREEMKEEQSPGRAELEGYRLQTLDTVKFGDEELEVNCAYQKPEKPAGGERSNSGRETWNGAGDSPKQQSSEVLATFSDGSPALIVQPLGKGHVAASGFFPGIGYVKLSSLARKELWERLEKEGKERTTISPPSYPENYRDLFAGLLNRLAYRPRVATDHPLVEANLLESKKGIVVALANWSGQPLKNVSLKIKGASGHGEPTSVFNAITSIDRAGQDLVLTLDLATIEFVVLSNR